MAIPCRKRLGLPLLNLTTVLLTKASKGRNIPYLDLHLCCNAQLVFSSQSSSSSSFSSSPWEKFANEEITRAVCFAFFFCKRNFHFLFPLPYFLLNPHGFSWVVDILRVDGSLLVSVLLLLLGVVHHHVVLEDEAEVDWFVVRPGERRGTV